MRWRIGALIESVKGEDTEGLMAVTGMSWGTPGMWGQVEGGFIQHQSVKSVFTIYSVCGGEDFKIYYFSEK